MAKKLSAYECVCAKDGQGAVDAFKKAVEQNRPFRVVFMDLEMPVMDGVKAAAEIRKQKFGQEALILCVSTTVSNEEKFQALNSNMTGFLPKCSTTNQLNLITDVTQSHCGSGPCNGIRLRRLGLL